MQAQLNSTSIAQWLSHKSLMVQAQWNNVGIAQRHSQATQVDITIK